MSVQIRTLVRSLVIAVGVAGAALLPSGRALAAGETNGSDPIADAQKLIAKGDLQQAEIDLRKASRANPGDPKLHIALAKLYLRMPNLPDAEAELRLAIQDKGDANDVDPLLALALFQQNKLEELFQTIEPDDRSPQAESQVRLTLGMAHLVLQEKNEAAPLLEAADRLDPTAATKAALAQLDLAQNDLAHAQDEIAAAKAIAPDDETVMRVSALVVLAQGDSAGAIKLLGDLLAKHPDDVAALGTHASLLVRAGKFTEAQSDIDHALKIAPHNPGIIYYHAFLLAREGKLDEADQQLNSISTAFSDIPVAYYLQGMVKYKLGQTQQAIEALSKYLARVPGATEARRLLAEIAIHQRDYTTAISELKPLVDKDPNDAASITLLAQAYLASGNRRNDALDMYERLVTLQPENVRAAVGLDVLKIQAGQVQQGVDQLDEMSKSEQKANAAGPALVIGDVGIGLVSDAERSAQALVDRNPQDLVAQSLLGSVKMLERKYAEAATIFKAVVDKDRTLIGAQRGLVQADISLGKLDDAKAVLQGMVQQHPDSVIDAIALARVEILQKDEADAEALLRKTQQAATTDPQPGLVLLQLFASQKAWDKAQSYGRELELQFPGDVRVVSTIAAERTAAGDAAGAAAEFSRLADETPNDPAILARYADYRALAGDKDGARALLQKALGLAPQNFNLMTKLANFDFDNGGLDKGLATARSFAGDYPLAADLIVAGLYERAHRLDDAIATLTAAMKRNPQTSVAIKLASDQFDKGEKSEGVATLRNWIKDHADDHDADLVLATLYDRLPDHASAQQFYEAAYKNSPPNWLIDNNLAVLYAAKGDPRARAFGEQAYYLDPVPLTADTYGWALVRTGDPAQGVRVLRVAVAGLKDNATVLYHMAVALKDTGDTKGARDILEKVVASGATFDDQDAAKQLLAELQRG
jgi:cellulose synthase operon protein C